MVRFCGTNPEPVIATTASPEATVSAAEIPHKKTKTENSITRQKNFLMDDMQTTPEIHIL
jgi:hypothetical protein